MWYAIDPTADLGKLYRLLILPVAIVLVTGLIFVGLAFRVGGDRPRPFRLMKEQDEKTDAQNPPSPFHQGGSGGILPVLFLGAVKVVSFFYAQPTGRISEVLIGIFKGNPMLPFDVG